MLLFRNMTVPRRWSAREGREYEWRLTEDKDSSQPIGLHIKGFGPAVGLYHPRKDGFQCTLGETGGRFCRIAPVRELKESAAHDCREFMRRYKNIRDIKDILDNCDGIMPDNEDIIIF